MRASSISSGTDSPLSTARATRRPARAVEPTVHSAVRAQAPRVTRAKPGAASNAPGRSPRPLGEGCCGLGSRSLIEVAGWYCEEAGAAPLGASATIAGLERRDRQGQRRAGAAAAVRRASTSELRESIGRWVRDEIAPNVDEWEEAREFPRELYERAGELGFLGLKYPVELGGQGGDYVHDAVWAEELAAAGASGGVGAGLGAHTGIATPPVFKFGTADQHERFLRPGDPRGADRRAGDHRAGRRLGRRLDPHPGAQGRRRLRGQRLEDVHHQRRPRRLPRLRGARRPRRAATAGISFLILEREMPGYEVARKLEKMGWHSSDTGELSFTDVEVPGREPARRGEPEAST